MYYWRWLKDDGVRGKVQIRQHTLLKIFTHLCHLLLFSPSHSSCPFRSNTDLFPCPVYGSLGIIPEIYICFGDFSSNLTGHQCLPNSSLPKEKLADKISSFSYTYIFYQSIKCVFLLLLFSHWVVCDSLQPHGLQHTRLPCPSLSPGACSNSYPLSQWCHPTISSSVAPFSSCPQSFPLLGSFPMSRLFTSGGQRIGAWASASVLPMNIQGWFPLGLCGLIFLERDLI